ncbi:hypothetical protein JCM33374_g3591 [Metschnikowia sp. JCM 33374]|nr:hypothetical protein JCM33374_g3591 [Metschnikowia sp. JCM 33374]
MPIAGSTSPSWSNEDADDFWDDDLGALDDDDLGALDDDDLGPLNNNLAPSTAPRVSKNEAPIHKNGGPTGIFTPPDVGDGSLGDGVSGTKALEIGGSAGFGEKIPHFPAQQKNTTNIQSETTSNPTLPTEDASIPLNTKSSDLGAESPETPGRPPQGSTDSSNQTINHKIQNESQEGAENPPAPKEKAIHQASTQIDIPTDLPQKGVVPVPPQAIVAPKQSQSSSTNKKDPEPVPANEPSAAQDSQPGENPVVVPENNHPAPAKQNGPEKAPRPTESSHAVRETVPKSVPSATVNKEDASSKTPRTDSLQNAKVLELTEQINALKLELEEKDAKLSQIEKAHPGSHQETEDSSASERIRQLEETLQQTEEERDQAQTQLEGFLSKISSMKTVFQNFKETQRELEEVKQELYRANEEREKAMHEKNQIHSRSLELERDQKKLLGEKDAWNTESKKYLAVIESLKSEALDLNSECDRLSQLMATLRREFQSKEESLQDEKYSLENEVSRLNKKLSEHRSMQSELELEKEEATIENKNLVLAMEEMKERLEAKEAEFGRLQVSSKKSQEVLESRIDQVESSLKEKNTEIASAQTKLEQLQAEITVVKRESEEKAAEIETLQKDKETIKSLQEEVHSKSLVIGKLRHEAIILNEHLTKSISMLKQQSGDTNKTVDRELVSNLILKFLQIPRGDTKKFEALSLIGGLLDWDEEKKIQAGLSHSGKNDDNKPQRSGIISLWTEFLDKESSKK